MEGKLDAVSSQLEKLLGDVHQLVQTLRECASQKGGVPEDVLRRDPVGVG